MANYIASARTNYVRFKDEAALQQALLLANKYRLAYYKDKPEEPLCAMFYSDDGDSGGFCLYDNEADAYGDWDEIATLMDDDQVLIVMEAGAEKLRYITGYARAWNSKGEVEAVNLNDIYEKARSKWGIDPTPAEYTALPEAKA